MDARHIEISIINLERELRDLASTVEDLRRRLVRAEAKLR